MNKRNPQKRKAESFVHAASNGASEEEKVIGVANSIELANVHQPRAKRARNEPQALQVPLTGNFREHMPAKSDQRSCIPFPQLNDVELADTAPVAKQGVGLVRDQQCALQPSGTLQEANDVPLEVDEKQGDVFMVGPQRDGAYTAPQDLHSYYGAAGANAASTKRKPELCIIKASCRYGWSHPYRHDSQESRTRYLSISSKLKYTEFKKVLARVFRITASFLIQFKDCEGDKVILGSDEDLRVLFRTAQRRLRTAPVELARSNDGEHPHHK